MGKASKAKAATKAERLDSRVVLLRAESLNDSVRRFRMVAYTGAEVGRCWGRLVVDLQGIKVPEKLPILLNHNPDQVVGYADEHELGDDGLVLEGPLVPTPEAARVEALSDAGFPWTASIGIRALSVEQVREGAVVQCNGLDVSGPCDVWRSSELFETSFIAANPADKATSAAALGEEHQMTPEEFLAANPAAVQAWRDEGATREREAATARLQALRAAIPGRPEFVLEQFASGSDVVHAKAALADVLLSEQAAAPAPAPAAAPAPVLDALRAQAGVGLGFDGPARQGGVRSSTAGLPPAERARVEFASDPAIARAFGSEEALAAYYRAESRGLVSPNVVQRAAGCLTGSPQE